MEINNILTKFEKPPEGYGEVAFFWWHGDKITKEKLDWILQQLKDSSVSGLQINYCHGDTGGLQWGLTLASDPKPLSTEWWELVGEFITECKKYGIAVSLSDYTLGAPGQGFYIDDVLDAHPEYTGQILEYKDGNISPVKVPNSINPMSKGVGNAVADAFYGEFERHFPNECGKGINYFFSDELNFNVRGNLWCDDFAKEFKIRKGYDIIPKLSAIFEDTGDETPKIRLDYYDVIVQLSEERYFEPVFTWHESRGMTFGCDHGGRGKDITEFGDYFRTMKWNGAPGNDQPHLESDIIKTKVSSSICHLYDRKRTWLEGFYSSGWGTSSADVADAVFRNFALGHNLLSLHGLYYSMCGSMWEWAPPCNHFHMPYWSEMPQLLKCTERLSWLLSQGYHCCDVAIVYPVADMEADIKHGELSVKTAFETGTRLYENGCDFDFIDFESIDRANIDPLTKTLHVKNAAYKAVIIPDMRAVRFSMLEKLNFFAKIGGIVVILGDLPQESDNAGRNDPTLLKITSSLEKNAVFASSETILDCLKSRFCFDFTYPCMTDKPFIQHRKIGGCDLYLIYGLPKGTPCFLRSSGDVLLFDAWSGKSLGKLDYRRKDGGIVLNLPKSKTEPNIFLISDENHMLDFPHIDADNGIIIDVTGEWECKICPTLDNTYGDYRLPITEPFIGAEVRSAKCCVTELDCRAAEFDDSSWQETDFGFGTQLWVASDSENSIEKDKCISMTSPSACFKPFRFSWRFGMRHDAGNQGSYHGLKGKITDDFLGLGEPQIMRLGSDVAYTGIGGWYVFTTIYCEHDTKAFVDTGKLCYDGLWINHIEASHNTVQLLKGSNTVLAHFPHSGRTHIVFLAKEADAQTTPLAMKWYNSSSVIPFDAVPEWTDRHCWLRFTSPPGMESMQMKVTGSAEAFCNGEKMSMKNDVFFPKEKQQRPAKIAVCICQKRSYYEGGALSEPIRFKCGDGIISIGDWSKIDGLRCYSGGILYRKIITLDRLDSRVYLNLGKVVSSASVYVNSTHAAVLCAPPFMADITKQVHVGENTIEILVHNTLANHMKTIPTIYQGDLESGIIGM